MFPYRDGGDGTCDLIIKKTKGVLVSAEVKDPLGRKINTSFGLIDEGNTAVIEMADASGIRLLRPSELDPLHTSSFGTGELINLALDRGVKRIILGLGGSATVDGGTGILKALGIRFLNSEGEVLSGIPESLVNLAEIDFSRLDQRIMDCELTVLCDVENKLLGDNGAAVVFGPQKGATSEVVIKLEASLTKLNEIALQQMDINMGTIKYGGAAGGVAAGLSTFLNANLVNGIEHFLLLTDFNEALMRSDLVITGEGSMDEQTLQGKGPFGVAYRAKSLGIPVIGLAGKVPLEENLNLQKYFDALISIGHEPMNLTTALLSTANNLNRASREIGNLLSLRE